MSRETSLRVSPSAKLKIGNRNTLDSMETWDTAINKQYLNKAYSEFTEQQTLYKTIIVGFIVIICAIELKVGSHPGMRTGTHFQSSCLDFQRITFRKSYVQLLFKTVNSRK